MAGLTGALTTDVVARLKSNTDGVNARVGAITQADATVQAVGVRTILAQNASAEITEKTGAANYPALLVYCDKLSNTLQEKFRQFSGRAHLVVEVRHSQDRLDSIESNLQVYVDAVCALLDDARGDWGDGSFYGGGYEVQYEPVTRGGINFLQRAKVGFQVEVSK